MSRSISARASTPHEVDKEAGSDLFLPCAWHRRSGDPAARGAHRRPVARRPENVRPRAHARAPSIQFGTGKPRSTSGGNPEFGMYKLHETDDEWFVSGEGEQYVTDTESGSELPGHPARIHALTQNSAPGAARDRHAQRQDQCTPPPCASRRQTPGSPAALPSCACTSDRAL